MDTLLGYGSLSVPLGLSSSPSVGLSLPSWSHGFLQLRRGLNSTIHTKFWISRRWVALSRNLVTSMGFSSAFHQGITIKEIKSRYKKLSLKLYVRCMRSGSKKLTPRVATLTKSDSPSTKLQRTLPPSSSKLPKRTNRQSGHSIAPFPYSDFPIQTHRRDHS